MTKEVVFVLGAGSDLGRALSEGLLRSADRHVVAVMRTDRSREFPGIFDGRLALEAGVDLTSQEAGPRLRALTERYEQARIHTVVCCGRFPGYARIGELTVEQVRAVMEDNVLATYAAALHLLPEMARRGGGAFLTFSSHSVPGAYPLMGAFTAAKAAVEALTKSIANEYGRDHIRANVLAPATIDVPSERSLRSEGDFDHWIRPEQIVEAVEDLISGTVSAVNGNVIHMYNYSESYFGESYYGRIGRRL